MHFASRTDVNTTIERTRQCFEFIAEFLPAFFRATVAQVEEQEEEGQRKDKYDELKEKMASYDWLP
jgi:hypothetical protein